MHFEKSHVEAIHVKKSNSENNKSKEPTLATPYRPLATPPIFVEVLQQPTLATPYRRVGSYMTATAQSHHK